MLSHCQTQNLLPRVSFYFPPISAFEIIPVALQLWAQTFSARPLQTGSVGDGAHPGPPSPGKVTAWIIGTNQVNACLEKKSLSAQRGVGLTHRGTAQGLNSPTIDPVNPQRVTDSHHPPALSLWSICKKKKKKVRDKDREIERGGGERGR